MPSASRSRRSPAASASAGSGWAADLLGRRRAALDRAHHSPEGFQGELRSYQGEAVAWLGFLDSVELGGCLALDMGLGKTPTMLAHIARTAGAGPALVVAPPAVVGNWAAEAARFTPGLRVVVHHGASRASADELSAEVADADVVITTYGTAVRDVEAISSLPWDRLVLDEAQAIKNSANETAQQLRRIPARVRIALTGTPIENGLGDLWSILDFTNPGLVGSRSSFVAALSAGSTTSRQGAETALRALNGILVFRRTKSEPIVAAELPERIDQLDHCTMTPEQIGLYQAVLDSLVVSSEDEELGAEPRKGAILAAITALKQICNHPAAYQDDGRPLPARSGKLTRLEEIVDAVFASGERVLVFTHFASWGVRLAEHLSAHTGTPVACYHGGLARGARDQIVEDFQNGEGPGALVLSLKAGGTGLNLTAASHVVLYDRWWNPAVEDQARDRAWRIGQTKTVISHRLVCPGTVDERVEEVVAGKRHIADLVLPKSSSLADLDTEQLRSALGLRPDSLLTENAAELQHDVEESNDARTSVRHRGPMNSPRSDHEWTTTQVQATTWRRRSQRQQDRSPGGVLACRTRAPRTPRHRAGAGPDGPAALHGTTAAPRTAERRAALPRGGRAAGRDPGDGTRCVGRPARSLRRRRGLNPTAQADARSIATAGCTPTSSGPNPLVQHANSNRIPSGSRK